MTLTAVASGRAKTECSAVVFDTGAGCRRNRDGVPYAVLSLIDVGVVLLDGAGDISIEELFP
jgi:hypothetical protein